MKILNITNIINNNVITLSDNYHKILKYQYNNYFMFYYYRETGSCHGFYNFDNRYLGYIYQNQRKGFVLQNNQL